VVVAPGVSNWGVIWPDFESAYVNIRNFVRDGQSHHGFGELNTIWHDDGETLTDMTWPGLVFGAAAGWQAGEANVDDFKKTFDWAFYRDEIATFEEVIDDLDKAHTLLAAQKAGDASDELFWSDPFSAGGAAMEAKALPAAHDLRLSAESAIELLGHNRERAEVHRETLDDIVFAAWRLDTLGLKIQFTSEIGRFYWDAYQNQGDSKRVEYDLDEIMGINGRLQSLRDAITELRKMYIEAWNRENRSYWLDNVLVRYGNLASEVQAKLVAVQEAGRQYDSTKTLPPPEQLGFFMKP
jgi:hexosaminidase